MNRRDFSRALIAVGLSPLLPDEVRAATIRYLNAQPGARVNPRNLRWHDKLVDGRRVVIDLARVANWSSDPTYGNSSPEFRMCVKLYAPELPAGFLPWCANELKNAPDVRIVHDVSGLDVTGTVESVWTNTTDAGEHELLAVIILNDHRHTGPRHARPRQNLEGSAGQPRPQ